MKCPIILAPGKFVSDAYKILDSFGSVRCNVRERGTRRYFKFKYCIIDINTICSQYVFILYRSKARVAQHNSDDILIRQLGASHGDFLVPKRVVRISCFGFLWVRMCSVCDWFLLLLIQYTCDNRGCWYDRSKSAACRSIRISQTNERRDIKNVLHTEAN